MAIQIDPTKLYHGVYPGGASGLEDDITPELVQEYEELSGRRVAWVYFSHNWYNGRKFPIDTVDWMRSAVASHLYDSCCGTAETIRAQILSIHSSQSLTEALIRS
jgi:hypothetical protein